MGYTGYKSTRPRSVLVILGGIVAWAGLVGGVLIATPQYHYAMTIQEEPVEMTWHELVENGLTDNSHVRLIDVAIENKDTPAFFEEMLDLDPDADPEDQQAAFEELAEQVDFTQVFEAVSEPLKVFPKGENAKDFPAKVVIPFHCLNIDAAVEEIESAGTLTGHFQFSDGSDIATQLMESFMSAAATQSAKPITDQDAPDSELAGNDDSSANATGAETEAGDMGEDAVIATGKTDEVATAGPLPQDADVAMDADRGDELQYLYGPVIGIPDRAESAQWFWLAGFAVAFGLVICGAGGPSLACCLFFQVPSILSMLGYPMRYGRATKTTRLVYLTIGLGLIGIGYDTMVVKGRIGEVDGDVLAAALGFVPTFVGAAAVLGVFTNVMMHRLNLSLEPATKQSAEPKINMTEACSLGPIEAEPSFGFEDRYLVPNEQAMPEPLEQVASALLKVGFEHPESMAHQDGLEFKPTLLQLGCQDMVVVDVDLQDGKVATRMTSVLHDGLTMITLSSNIAVENQTRMGTSGMYTSSDSSDPIEMLSSHLEGVIELAEKRQTSIVALEPSELIDVALCSQRVLADIKAQYGEDNVEVEPASYGRFHVPIQPIPSCAAV